MLPSKSMAHISLGPTVPTPGTAPTACDQAISLRLTPAGGPRSSVHAGAPAARPPPSALPFQTYVAPDWVRMWWSVMDSTNPGVGTYCHVQVVVPAGVVSGVR